MDFGAWLGKWWNNPNAPFPFNNRGEIDLKTGKEKVPEGKSEDQLKQEAEAAAEKEAAEKGKPVTQEAINRIYGKLKETEEKLVRSEQEKVGLVGRLSEVEKRLPAKQPAGDAPLREQFTEKNFPRTEEEWDDLASESPTYAMDLRSTYNASRRKSVDEQERSRQSIMKDNPDMYQRDADGKFVLDAQGYPQLDMTTKKAQIFCEEAEKGGSDENGYPLIMKVANGPEMVMAQTRLRLSGDEEATVKEKIKKEKEEKEAARRKQVGDGGIASGGTGAPPAPKVEVKFNSDQEKAIAEQAVSAGKYKDLQEYCNVRDNVTVPYGRGGF